MGTILNGKSVVETCYVVLVWYNRKGKNEWKEVCKHYHREEAELNAQRITDINKTPTMIAEWITTSSVVKTFKPQK